ncbi:MAG: endo alpha-1,4 polygalactosaminidase [Chloroflexi bacterium]|nr:endo alpha-1,4 polygalactosaminidase [Chloroflexota bacterium]
MMMRVFLFLLLVSVILLMAGCSQKENNFAYAKYDLDIPSSPPPAAEWWQPSPGLTWQWQLSGQFDDDIQVDVYDIDANVHKSAVDHFHQQGSKVICYISAGSYEKWRADADQFPDELLGNDYEGWAGEKWLDIRRIDLLAPIMQARLDECAEKGFDAIEPDNIEIYTNETGFPLTYEDQLRYAVWLANEAHARGLAIALKNAPDQVEDLVDLYDFAITEDCFYYGWCEEMRPFIQAGKVVFAAEYTDLDGDFDEYCRQSKELGFSTILKNRNLGAWLETCPN